MKNLPKVLEVYKFRDCVLLMFTQSKAKLPKWFGERPGKKSGEPESLEDEDDAGAAVDDDLPDDEEELVEEEEDEEEEEEEEEYEEEEEEEEE